jgi:hypothetical protein
MHGNVHARGMCCSTFAHITDISISVMHGFLPCPTLNPHAHCICPQPVHMHMHMHVIATATHILPTAPNWLNRNIGAKFRPITHHHAPSPLPCELRPFSLPHSKPMHIHTPALAPPPQQTPAECCGTPPSPHSDCSRRSSTWTLGNCSWHACCSTRQRDSR